MADESHRGNGRVDGWGSHVTKGERAPDGWMEKDNEGSWGGRARQDCEERR